MKGISEKFTEEEFDILKKEKDKYNKSWHDFILDVKKLKDENVILREDNNMLKEEIRKKGEVIGKFIEENNELRLQVAEKSNELEKYRVYD